MMHVSLGKAEKTGHAIPTHPSWAQDFANATGDDVVVTTATAILTSDFPQPEYDAPRHFKPRPIESGGDHDGEA
jgi:hypothetical protein